MHDHATRHAARPFLLTGLPPAHCGEAHANAKVTSGDVATIRSRRAAGETLTTLAEAFGLGTSQIWRICRGESWAS